MADDFRFTILRESGKKFPILARLSKKNTDLFSQWYKGGYSHQYIIVHCMDVNTKNNKKWCEPINGEYRYPIHKTWGWLGSSNGSIIIKRERTLKKGLFTWYGINNSRYMTYPRKKGDDENENFGKREWITPSPTNKNNMNKINV